MRRYCTFQGFEAMMRNGTIRFSTVLSMEQLELPDRHEAHLPDWKIAEWNEWWDGRSTEEGWLPEWNGLNAEDHVMEAFKQRTGISCWTHSDETLPMWSIYGERARGVMLVATIESIVDAFIPSAENDIESIFVGKIGYPSGDDLRAMPVREINPVSVGFIKRPIFSWEEETRLAVVRVRTTPPHDLLIDPTILLNRVVVGPKADDSEEHRVRALVAEIAPSVEVVKSDLLEFEWE